MPQFKSETDLAAALDELELLRRFKAESIERDMQLTAVLRDLEDTRAALKLTRKCLEASRHEIQDADRQWHAAFDEETDLMFLYDRSYRLIRANRAYMERAGATQNSVIGKPYWEVFPKMRGPLREHPPGKENSGGSRAGYEVRLDTGEFLLSRSTPIHGEFGEYLCTLHILQDVTAQKRVESAYRRSSLTLKMLRECVLEMAQATDERRMLQTVCRVLVERYGFHSAWVRYPALGLSEAPRGVISFGRKSDHLAMQNATGTGDAEDESNPAAIAMRTGAPFVAQNVLNDPQFATWRADAARSGYGSILGLPLRDKQNVLGALCVYAVEPFAFAEEELRLLESLAADIVFGITAFRVRAERNANLSEREHYLSHLRDGLESVIESLVTAVEIRDSRNVRHQSRVAELAMAIAAEMGLERERVRGIRLAGMVHDIGEIHIPPEISNKTGALTEEQVDLERQHPRFGYDILKEVDLPWPIAEILLQHHERLDGSGYPRGLKGDEILLEAGIVGLADIIVAMAYQQNPHRPKLGVPAALAEVEREKGSRYDPAAVEAALRLFRDKGFSLM